MKIAFSGSHGTGKTTNVFKLANELKIDNNFKEIGIIQEIERECPFEILDKHTEKSILWTFSKQIERELFYSNIYDIMICDRTILDHVAYAKTLNIPIWKNLLELSINHIKSYDIIYFKKIDFNDYYFDDGVKIFDKEFRSKLERILLELYMEILTDFNTQVDFKVI